MKTYSIIKINSETEETRNYGAGYTEEDVKEITKGYKFNGLFYNRIGSKFFFIVTEDK